MNVNRQLFHSPLFEIALPELVKPICADGQRCSNDDRATRTSKWEISFVLDAVEASRRRHIPNKMVSLTFGTILPVHTVCKVLTLRRRILASLFHRFHEELRTDGGQATMKLESVQTCTDVESQKRGVRVVG
jgi:hypothetical protein